MVFISQVEVLITLVVITFNSKLGCFSFFFFFFVQLVKQYNSEYLAWNDRCVDAARLETIVDEDEAGDSDMEID